MKEANRFLFSFSPMLVSASRPWAGGSAIQSRTTPTGMKEANRFLFSFSPMLVSASRPWAGGSAIQSRTTPTGNEEANRFLFSFSPMLVSASRPWAGGSCVRVAPPRQETRKQTASFFYFPQCWLAHPARGREGRAFESHHPDRKRGSKPLPFFIFPSVG